MGDYINLNFDELYKHPLISDNMINKCELAKKLHKKGKVFDWDEAARIIKRDKTKVYEAGLREDWFCTSDIIFENGEAVNGHGAFLKSLWATPVLYYDNTYVECYIDLDKEKSKFDEYTVWPKSSLEILGE